MNRYKLQTSVEIKGVVCEFNSDFRDILEIFSILNEPNLLEFERIALSLQHFYKTDDYKIDMNLSIKEMLSFITMNDVTEDTKAPKNKKPLYDWEQDYNLIVAPINKIVGYDVRGTEYMHWWTFLSAFMEIGESTFSTYVAIRDKLNRGKKLDKHEERILRDNRDSIIIKSKVDDGTQELLNEIMGV